MKEKLQTNLRVLKRTRKKPEAGDIFTFQLEPLPTIFFYGKVIKTDTKIGNIDDVILIYIYKNTSTEKYSIPLLSLKDLMLPPIGINKLPWTKGYFEVLNSIPIDSEEVISQHCFQSFDNVLGTKFYDEYGNRLAECTEPCGTWGMAGYGTIDRAVSKFMGIPMAS